MRITTVPGFTREFNLNLLTRINNELQGNFDIDNFYIFLLTILQQEPVKVTL